MTTRILTGLLGAAAITLALFWLMQSLLNAEDLQLAPPPGAIELVRTKIVADPPPPPPPVTRETAPQPLTPSRPQAVVSVAPVSVPAPQFSLPTIATDLVVTGRTQQRGIGAGVVGQDALAAFSAGGQSFAGAELVPVSSARPKYPRSAAERGIEGWVELIFVVTGEGRVQNVRIIDASPRGVFEDAAVSAISNWLYEPYYINGKAVAREGTQLFRFRREDIQEIYLWDD